MAIDLRKTFVVDVADRYKMVVSNRGWMDDDVWEDKLEELERVLEMGAYIRFKYEGMELVLCKDLESFYCVVDGNVVDFGERAFKAAPMGGHYMAQLLWWMTIDWRDGGEDDMPSMLLFDWPHAEEVNLWMDDYERGFDEDDESEDGLSQRENYEWAAGFLRSHMEYVA